VSEYFNIYLYFGLAAIVTLAIVAACALFPSKSKGAAKFLPYESGIITETNLLNRRFPMHHYLVALVFLVFDTEVVFLYPWAVIAKQYGSFAFYEMTFFLLVLLIGFAYIWHKGGLQWE
jgi:NADH:ubiquinone oxidoreductase subunit 3 (subunit A)